MDVVKYLNKADLRNFNLFVKRSNLNKSEFQVIDLIEAYKSNKYKSDAELAKDVFPDIKMSAFYRLKNRALEDLHKSLLIINYSKDERIFVLNVLVLAQIFKYKQAFKTSYNLLVQAEKKAAENDLLEELHLIYNEIISLSLEYTDIPLYEYLDKKNNIDEKLLHYNKAQDFITILSYKLKNLSADISGKEIIIELEKIFEELEGNELLKKSIAIRFQLNSVVRNILRQNEDYEAIITFMQKSLIEFEQDGLFTKIHFKHKIVMLVWIINAHIRLYNFDKVLKLSEQLLKAIKEFKGLYYNTYIWTYYQSVFSASYYLGEIEKCNELLQEWKIEQGIESHSYYNLFLEVNNVVVQYCLGNIKKAMKAIAALMVPKILNAYSSDLRFNFIVVDLILYYENKDYDFLIYQIKEVKRKYNHVLKLDKMNEEKQFINLLNKMAKERGKMTNLSLIEKIKAFNLIENSNLKRVNSINYKIWLSAKLQNKEYYKVLTDEVNKMSVNIKKAEGVGTSALI